MLTETRSKINYPADIEMVEYPPDVIERLEAEAEITSLQIDTGEIQYISLEDFARELGVNFTR